MGKVDTGQLTKLYYSISEVAKMFDVNTSLIRFWEKEFPALDLRKSKNGRRQFTVKDIELFNRIHHLVKVKGFTLEGAKKELKKSKNSKNQEESELSNEQIIDRLENVKEQLLKLRSNSN